MELRIVSSKHEIVLPASLLKEKEILQIKLKEFRDSVISHSFMLEHLREDEEISQKIYVQLLCNVMEIKEDVEKHVREAQDVLKIRFTMGMIEAAVEWLNKPLIPLQN